MTEAKRFTENIARIAKKMAGECECKGTGERIGGPHVVRSVGLGIAKCYDCQKLRELAELCHHERGENNSCIHCGNRLLGIIDSDEEWNAEMNPAFTVQTMQPIMEELGSGRGLFGSMKWLL